MCPFLEGPLEVFCFQGLAKNIYLVDIHRCLAVLHRKKMSNKQNAYSIGKQPVPVRTDITLGIQLPFEKVFNLQKTPQTTFVEGIWIPRERLSFF